jgi:hypothetical protein
MTISALHREMFGLYLNSPHTVKKNKEALLEVSREVGLEVNTEKTKYMVVSHHQNVEQNYTNS